MRNSKRSEIRFPGFTVEWNQCKLEDVADRMKSYSLSRDVETADDTGYKYIHYGDIHTKVADIIDENSELPNIKVGDYELLQKNDVVVADASEDYQGIATPAVVIYTPEFNLVSGLHTIALRPKKTVAIYLYYLLNTQIFKKYGYKVGTGMKVFGISSTNLMKFEARYPSLDEQEQIGNFLKQLDDTIILYQNELDILKKTKKGFLQKMFPKEGESVPEIRFPGFADDWEQREFSEMYDILSGFAFTMSEYIQSGVPIVNGESIRHGNIASNAWNFLPEEYLEKYHNFILHTGDIVLGLNRPITNGSLKIAQVPASLDKSLIYQRAGKVINLLNTDVSFSYQLLENEIFKFVIKEAVGSDQPFISTTKLKKWSFWIPVSIEEQIKIGNFFKQLDNTITLHQRELDVLKKTKKAFLQKMFINS